MEKVMRCSQLLCISGTLKADSPERSRVLKKPQKTLRPAALFTYSETSCVAAGLRTSTEPDLSCGRHQSSAGEVFILALQDSPVLPDLSEK